MLYTLLKFLGWGALLAFIGGCIGWALRALKCRGEIARAKSVTVDVDEVERMRHRLANLEQVVAERDRLRIQLADVRHADSPGIVGAEVPEPPVPEPRPEPEPEPEPESQSDADVEMPSEDDASTDVVAEDDLSSKVPGPDTDTHDDTHDDTDTDDDTHDDTDADTDDTHDDTDTDDGGGGGGGEASGDGSTTVAGFADAGGDEPTSDAPAVLDLDAAATELGKKVELDDLTVVEGIGPKISELCSGIGITTWRQLADTDVTDLQSMLDAAGSRYTVHKPGAWPRQAELLATGNWADFTAFTDELDGGK